MLETVENRIVKLREAVDEDKILRRQLNRQIADNARVIARRKSEVEDLIEARMILRVVAENTQGRFKTDLERLVTLTLQAVFDRYEFSMTFKKEREKPVCFLKLIDNGHELTPKEDVGVGALDICAYVLQVMIISLTDTAMFLWSDEPMRHLGGGEDARRAGRMIKSLSKKLGLQIVINTHDPTLIEIGDRVWKFVHNGTYTESELVVDRWGV